MEKLVSHTGVAVPLRRSNVDTDQIIPAVFLKRVTKTGFADGLFASWRNRPDFVLNDPAYAQGTILVAGPDFGTGSSREHAVWALKDYGFKVVLSTKFADIFRGNAGKQGLVAGVISPSDLEKLWGLLEETPGSVLTIDLPSKTVTSGSFSCGFELDDYTCWRIMEGMDDISLTMQRVAEIDAFEKKRPTFKPVPLPALHLPAAKVEPARPNIH